MVRRPAAGADRQPHPSGVRASNDPVGHLADIDEDLLLGQCRARARAALAAGITTVRDLGDRRFVTLRLREELAADPARGPQLLVSGPPVTTPGGHCWFLGGEAAGVQGVRAAVRALAARGAAGSIPIHPLARAYARRAEQTARRTGQLWPLGYVRFITCVYMIGAARWEELHEALEEAEGLLERAGDRRALGDALTVQAMSSLYRGEFRPAAAGLDDVHRRGRRYENVQHQVWGLLGKAECELRAGRLDEAARLLEPALALLADHPDRAEQLRAYGLLAVVRLRQGKAEAGRQDAGAAARLIAKFRAPTAHYLLEGYAGAARAVAP